jgi:signal transduction histidine kinase/DNA-binding response OmpR family regulator
LPPWWRSIWAYSTYAIIFVLTLYALRTYDQKKQRLKNELKLKNLYAENLEEVDRMKSRFFTNISHEFRTPLTLIKGPLNQMLSGEFTGNIKEQYKIMLRNSDRLLNLINEILDLSKIESGKMKLQVAKTDILQLAKGLVLSFSSLAESKKITLNFNTNEKSLYGYIDRDKVEKIFTNILSNAFKYTPEGKEIEVTVEIPKSKHQIANKYQVPNYQLPDPNPDFVEITISNTGAFIPEEQLNKIFDRFYQAHGGYKKDSRGSGVGLALTKELVEIHHGTITVKSIQDKKTTFNVILPVDKAHYLDDEIIDTIPSKIPSVVKQQHEETSETVEIQSNQQKVSHKKSLPILLIVEDYPDVTSYICSFLDKKYHIITAENGKEGLKKALAKFPDLIISDVMMPEMDGFELCRRIKSDERISHIPLILLTAKADLDSKLEGLEFGADDYIVKPFDAEELTVRSENLLEQRRRLRDHFEREITLHPSEITVNSMDEQFMQRVIELIEQHMDDTDFSVERFAEEIGMSRRHLNRKLHALVSHSALDFIRTIRLKRAAQLLREKSDSIAQIAYKVGFNNPAYFAQCFRQRFGTSPSNYTR